MRHAAQLPFALLILALACAVPAFAAGASLPVPASDQAAAVALQQASSTASACAESVTAPAAVPAPEWLSQASCCISRCRRDSDCTTFCGGPGQCIMVNSCCRECACFQL